MREAELKAVIAACEELDIAIAGYSPLGRGLLTTPYKSFDEVPESKSHFDGFSCVAPSQPDRSSRPFR